jgi:alpha/beta superfamily hydrolase
VKKTIRHRVDRPPAMSENSALLVHLNELVLQERRERIEREQWEQKRRKMLSVARRQPMEGEEEITFSVPGGGGCCLSRSCRGLLALRATRLGCIVCHPWGPLGGSMFDPNVATVLQAFGNISTLRFNFRSGLDCGLSSAADLRAAIKYMLSLEAAPEQLIVIGYSYGSLVVAEVAPEHEAVSAFAMIAPPLGVSGLLYGPLRKPREFAKRSPKPKLALIGGSDQFCSAERFEAWAAGLASPASFCVMEGPLERTECCGGAHVRSVPRPIMHQNVHEVLEPHLRSWIKATFGCPLDELATCEGDLK